MHFSGTLLLLPGLTLTSLGQPLSRQDLSQDLAFLQEALQHGHPDNYLHNNAASLTQLLDSINTLGEVSLSPASYRLVIGSALQRIGCVHTTVAKNPALQNHPSLYFPLAMHLLQQKLYVSRQSPANQRYEGQDKWSSGSYNCGCPTLLRTQRRGRAGVCPSVCEPGKLQLTRVLL